MSEEFKREVRYVVTKIKTGKQVTCVVVEEDWPEYETVWRMIQDRMEGRPNELEQLRARNAELERQLAEAKELLDKAHATWMAEVEASGKNAAKARKEAERAEQAEQRIAESQRQGPVAYYVLRDGIEEPLYFRYFCSAHRYAKDEDILPLYARPVVPPDVAEAVKELADWIATQRNDVPATGEEFAAAIRARSGK